MKTIPNWTPVGDLQLEPNALKAIKETERCIALTAGPGAGKTEMLAQRADFLLRTGCCVYPKRILAVAFKVDAARNLRSRVRKRCPPTQSDRFDSYTFHAFAKKLIDLFRPVLTGQMALDAGYAIGASRVYRKQITFVDLVPFAIEILRKSDIAKNAIRQTYSHVFLDEFQDCTNIQYEFVKVAFCNSDIPITVVGDTKQRIMGWAGALEGIFSQYAADFNAVSLNLYQNFRSKPLLRMIQNAMVEVMDPEGALPISQFTGSGGSAKIIRSANDEKEADEISDWIESRLLEGIPASEIAILVPKQAEQYTGSIVKELVERHIPYRYDLNLQDLSTEPLTQLMTDFLSVVVGERQVDASERLMGMLLGAELEDEKSHITRVKWYRFIEQCRKGCKNEFSAGDLVRLSNDFLEKVGLETITSLSVEYQYGDRISQVVSETQQRLVEFCSRNREPIDSLMKFSEKVGVRIMTVHKSKGLEFESVVLLGVENEMFWGRIEDERSVFFVGISRAKSELVLTTSRFRQLPQNFKGRWSENRTEQKEFINYVNSVL
jgi:superfamily I DNA/RNA helicase